MLYLTLALPEQIKGLLLALVAGQVLVLRVPVRPAETLGRLPVALADEHLAFVVVVCGRTIRERSEIPPQKILTTQ